MHYDIITQIRKQDSKRDPNRLKKRHSKTKREKIQLKKGKYFNFQEENKHIKPRQQARGHKAF